MVAIDRSHLLDLLQRMIRANSVIPREEPLAALLADEIKKLGLEPVWHEVAPGRPNVYASAVLGPRDRFVTFTGHLDTVGPALGWETDPFEPAMTEARLSGWEPST